MKIAIKSVIAIALPFFLAGCNEEEGNNPISDLVGVYDASEDFSSDGLGIDQRYLYIALSGETIEYDYMGDDVDIGDDCYDISWYDQLTHIEGDVFYSDLFESEVRFNILSDGTLRTINIDDPDNYSDFPAVDLSISNMNANECVVTGSALLRNAEPKKAPITYFK